MAKKTEFDMSNFPPPPIPPKELMVDNHNQLKFELSLYRFGFAIATVFLILVTVILFTGQPQQQPASNLKVTCDCEQTVTQREQNLVKENYIQGTHYTFDWRNLTVASNVYDLIRLHGNSMNPTYFDNNMAMMMKVPKNYIFKSGDIVSYVQWDTPGCVADKNSQDYVLDIQPMTVVHRITAVYGDKIVTEGDNNVMSEQINSCQINGLIVGILYT